MLWINGTTAAFRRRRRLLCHTGSQAGKRLRSPEIDETFRESFKDKKSRTVLRENMGD
jgi:hypothetical protein